MLFSLVHVGFSDLTKKVLVTNMSNIEFNHFFTPNNENPQHNLVKM